MRALLGDTTILEHEDDVCVLNRRESVGDGDRRAVLGRLVERALYHALGLAVEGGRRLVEQEDLGVADQGAGDSDALCVEESKVSAGADLRSVAAAQCDGRFERSSEAEHPRRKSDARF